MIVFGKSWAYSVQGRKVDEILEYIHKNLDFTYVETEQEFQAVKAKIIGKLQFYNMKYPKTMKYYLSEQKDYLRIGATGSAIKGINISLLRVKRLNMED